MRWCPMMLACWLLAGCGGGEVLSPSFESGRTTPAPKTVAKQKPKPNPVRPRADKPTAMATDAPLGRVVSVNPNLRFAVIDFGLGQMPAVGDRLGVFRGGLKVGEMKITGPQQESNIVGDILSGDVRSDDQVRRE